MRAGCLLALLGMSLSSTGCGDNSQAEPLDAAPTGDATSPDAGYVSLEAEFALLISTPGDSDRIRLSAHPAGGAVFVGTNEGATSMNGQTLTSGAKDAFIVRVDDEGAVLWQRTISGASAELADLDVEVDSAGSVWVAGVFEGSVDLGEGLVDAQHGAFVLRLQESGSQDLVQVYEGPFLVARVGPDNAGGAYVAATWADGSVVVGGEELTPSEPSTGIHTFTARLGSNGDVSVIRRDSARIRSIRSTATGYFAFMGGSNTQFLVASPTGEGTPVNHGSLASIVTSATGYPDGSYAYAKYSRVFRETNEHTAVWNNTFADPAQVPSSSRPAAYVEVMAPLADGGLLYVGMVDYSDGKIVVDVDGDEIEVDLTYQTSDVQTEQPYLQLSLKSIPDGTFEGTLTGIYQLGGDIKGEVELNLAMSGTLRDAGGGVVARTPGSTTGVYEVELTI